MFFWSIFSPKQAILSTFRFFQFFQFFFNCAHYFCLPSTKIVVTMFALLEGYSCCSSWGNVKSTPSFLLGFGVWQYVQLFIRLNLSLSNQHVFVRESAPQGKRKLNPKKKCTSPIEKKKIKPHDKLLWESAPHL